VFKVKFRVKTANCTLMLAIAQVGKLPLRVRRHHPPVCSKT